MKCKALFSIAVAGCFLLFTGPRLYADTLSDYFNVYDSGGGLVGQVSVNDSEENTSTFSGPGALFVDNTDPLSPAYYYYINDPTLADPLQFGNFVSVCEFAVCDPVSGPFSDTFGVLNFFGFNSDPNFYLGFASDSEGGSVFGGGGSLVIENAGPFDATSFLDLVAHPGYTAQFWSDPEPLITQTPEPSTLLLLGSGLLGVFGWKFRPKK